LRATLRKCGYFVDTGFTRLRNSPFWLLVLLLHCCRQVPRSHGIPLYNLSTKPGSDDLLFSCVTQSLELISQIDPRRFQRFRTEVKAILNTRLLTTARYQRLGRVCLIDLNAWEFAADPEFSIKSLACTLVHEATHGQIYSKLIPYRRQTRQQIEKLCTVEQLRFARRFEDPAYNWEKHFSIRLGQLDEHAGEGPTFSEKLKNIRRIWEEFGNDTRK
jgi:hypothetical protein